MAIPQLFYWAKNDSLSFKFSFPVHENLPQIKIIIFAAVYAPSYKTYLSHGVCLLPESCISSLS